MSPISVTFEIGEMKKRIILLSRSVSTETGSFLVPDLTYLATVWAKWENVHGMEVWTAQSVNAIQPATVTVRYRNDIDTTCVINKGGSVAPVLDKDGKVTGYTVTGGMQYQIVSVDDIEERHEYIEMKVQRVASG
jgi:head-tail adaptor